MTDKRMLILPAELVKKIDENRGDMNQADFLNYLIDSHFTEEEKIKPEYATKEEIRSFEQDMKQLLKSFLDFFVSYGLEFEKNLKAAEFPGDIAYRMGLILYREVCQWNSGGG